MVAVIDGAVKDNLSAIICCTMSVSLSFNSAGVNANIAFLQSLLPGPPLQVPTSLISSKFL